MISGVARLRFSRCGHRTILERGYSTSPLKIITTRGVGDTCWAYAATFGGGIVGGDEIDITIDAAAGAKALMATQASTKVYKSLKPASQRVTASIGDDAVLAVLPDPVVCFADAHFSQAQRYDVAERGNLAVLDWVTSGRHAVGERWAFRHYSSRIEIRRADRRVLNDAMTLDEEDGNISRRLSRFDVLATAIVSGPLFAAAASAIIEKFRDLDVETPPALMPAAWPLRDGGVMIRVAGVDVEEVGDLMRETLAFLREPLGDDPWIRKW